jgi:hypothetical protein
MRFVPPDQMLAEKFDARMVMQAITILVKDKRPIKLPQVPSAAALSAAAPSAVGGWARDYVAASYACSTR